RTPAWPPKSAPRLFVEQTVEAGRNIRISGNQAHYLSKVMRLSLGDAVILCDDVTGEWACKAADVSKREVWLEPAEHLRPREEVPDFWLCPALLKKDRFDMVLEKATELGVRAIQPVIMRRCVADKLNHTRASTLIAEAAEQCARTALPYLHEPQKLDAMLRNWPDDRTLFFADEEGGVPAAEAFTNQDSPAALLIGPEGGFDDAEREMLRSHAKVSPISLGPRILRGETAAIAATALWMGIRGDWQNAE
ncbi:MAG: 16S rRNA (uracil(1498)-N(3))-methyltransferase, partial [Erythrobacter sp.]